LTRSSPHRISLRLPQRPLSGEVYAAIKIRSGSEIVGEVIRCLDSRMTGKRSVIGRFLLSSTRLQRANCNVGYQTGGLPRFLSVLPFLISSGVLSLNVLSQIKVTTGQAVRVARAIVERLRGLLLRFLSEARISQPRSGPRRPANDSNRGRASACCGDPRGNPRTSRDVCGSPFRPSDFLASGRVCAD
jgi:hypothetical protein